MKPFQDFLADQGLNTNATPPPIRYYWYAYSKGNVTKHATSQEASKVSKNIEKAEDEHSRRMFDLFNKEYTLMFNKAEQQWELALRAKYMHLTDEMYQACKSEAERITDYGGYDRTSEEMLDVVLFAEKVIKLNSNPSKQ